MASLSRDSDGRFTIQVVCLDRKRRSIRLGKVPDRTAERIHDKIERLMSALKSACPPDDETARWLDRLDDRMHQKLVRAGLVPSRTPAERTTLAPFLNAYLDSRNDLKPPTKIVRRQVIEDLTQFFGEDRDVRTITPGDGDDFKQYLVGRKLAGTTIHKRLQNARWFFHAMRRRKLIDENPFDGVKAAATGIRDRQRFISRADIALVLEACPDHSWRTIVALARYAGLRTPSETLSLRWQDVDWERGRLTVTSPKTEHHEGHDTRVTPLFPELLPYLEEAFELAPEGAEYVVDERFRKAALGEAGWMNTNLRTTFEKIIRRAGLTPWPKLFQNLRSTRQTELEEQFPSHVVCAWMGNSVPVARKHYLQVTEDHFAKAVHFPVQHGPESARTDSQDEAEGHEKTPAMQGCAVSCESVQDAEVAEEGFEPPTRGL